MQRRLLQLLGATAAGTLLASFAAVDAGAVPPAGLIVGNQTTALYDIAQAITLTVNIDVPGVDTDNNGFLDRVQLRVRRPLTAAGVTIPTIIEPSPYYTHSPDTRVATHETEILADGTTQQNLAVADSYEAFVAPNPPVAPTAALNGSSTTFMPWLDNYFVPRGYAVAELDALGTGSSGGCVSPGSADEQAGIEAAVNWLNGTPGSRAMTTGPNARVVTAADWSNGSVALFGTSYGGALAIEGATSGVAGLKTIVSVNGIADWYRYTRSNGVAVGPDGSAGYDLDNLAGDVGDNPVRDNCLDDIDTELTDRLEFTKGDRNAFWDDRNYSDDIAVGGPSQFLIQGTDDGTVRPENGLSYWQALQTANVPRKLWTFQGGHRNPYSIRRVEYVRQLHAWFDHWLWDIDNGIMNEPRVDVQHTNLEDWSTQDAWPVKQDKTLYLTPLGLRSVSATSVADYSMTDTGATTSLESRMSQQGNGNSEALAYLTNQLDRDVTIQGTPEFQIRAKLDGPSPYLTAMLVDYGPQVYPQYTGYAQEYDLCDGSASATNVRCLPALESEQSNANYRVISRGWLDGRNRFSTRLQSSITDGTFYTFIWKGQPTSYTVAANHRIGIVLASSDGRYTPRYRGAGGNEDTELTVRAGGLQNSKVTLPISAGIEAFN